MKSWILVVGIVVCILILIGAIFIYRNRIWITGFRIICDAKDQKTFNAIIDAIAEEPHIFECALRERDDVTIIDIYCRIWQLEKFKTYFKKIENVEVQ